MMENPEEILQALEMFARLKPQGIPAELEEYLRFVAKTGDPVYQWSLVKPLYVQKLNNVISEFFDSQPMAPEIPPSPNVEPWNYERMKTMLLERLETFMGAPFTIQRISELLVSPRSEYNRIDKYMRAVEKNVLVVSTRDSLSRSQLDSVKNQEAVNGIPENNGTADDMGRNMLNSELGLQNSAPPPSDELLDIKADELEMDSLLIENIPDDKIQWVKADNITNAINSAASIAAEMTSQNSEDMSTDIDLVSTESNPIAESAPPEPVPETISQQSVEPMCVEPDPAMTEALSEMTEPMASMSETLSAMTEPLSTMTEPLSNMTDQHHIMSMSEPVPTEAIPTPTESVPSVPEPVITEPMAVESSIEMTPIDTNEMVPEPIKSEPVTVEASIIKEATEVSETTPEHCNGTIIDPSMPDSNTANNESGVADEMSLLSEDSMSSNQLSSVAGEVTSSLNVLVTEESSSNLIGDNSIPQVTECDSIKNESEMLIESSSDAQVATPDVQSGSEAQAMVSEAVPETSTVLPEIPATSTSSSDSVPNKDDVSTTSAESADEENQPTITLPEDESSNEAPTATTSEPKESASSSNPADDILVTLLADNESLGSTDEVIGLTPVVTEPQDTPTEQATTSTSASVIEE